MKKSLDTHRFGLGVILFAFAMLFIGIFTSQAGELEIKGKFKNDECVEMLVFEKTAQNEWQAIIIDQQPSKRYHLTFRTEKHYQVWFFSATEFKILEIYPDVMETYPRYYEAERHRYAINIDFESRSNALMQINNTHGNYEISYLHSEE